ncbi:MAG: class I SAM-dependent methyltransferase [Bacteroidetes bacterium]|nr:class I SAM-dependent methyltransferase [Bacteroidota bacterium]MBL6944159.1 class I SAM-dependent methyltransferase [Bacteroidales bacterium]
MDTFNIIQLGLLAVLLGYFLYYVYTLLFSKSYQPLIWKSKLKKGMISQELHKAERKYMDKARFFNFWFQVERLKKDKVLGSFAELGVYKGDSAEIIHLMDPSREIHLFDTFEGFHQKDLEVETGKAATYTVHNFADTSIERVKQKLKSDKFIFHKGYFPDTTEYIINEKFALVNMDADLYNPTKAGLEFFYPRLSPGGVIIIHDYNPEWPGIMKAVDDFAQTLSISIVPLTDTDSSAMLFKQAN